MTAAQLSLLCPLCGQPHTDLPKPHFIAARNEVVFKGRTARLQPMQLELFALLLEAYPRSVSPAQIYAELYSDIPDDKCPGEKLLSVRVFQMRQIFKTSNMPIEIIARRGRGERSGYALQF